MGLQAGLMGSSYTAQGVYDGIHSLPLRLSSLSRRRLRSRGGHAEGVAHGVELVRRLPPLQRRRAHGEDEPACA
jgi:hypothetical protein